MLESKQRNHTQWTSPRIQDELIGIIADLVRDRIIQDVVGSKEFSLIMDETSDISRGYLVGKGNIHPIF